MMSPVIKKQSFGNLKDIQKICSLILLVKSSAAKRVGVGEGYNELPFSD